jgi:putative ABC transport system permease protein
VGGVLGLILSFPVISFFPKDVEQYFPGLYISRTTVLIGLATALVVGLLAAILPAWRAARVGIATALRRVG